MMRRNRFFTLGGLASVAILTGRSMLLLCALAPAIQAQSLPFEDDFEQADTSEWTQGITQRSAAVSVSADRPHSGEYSAKHHLIGPATVQSLMRAQFMPTSPVFARVFFYLEPELVVTGELRLLQLFTSITNRGQFVTLRNVDGRLYIRLEGQDTPGRTEVSRGVWHGLELAYDSTNGTASVYLDGVDVPEASAAGLTLDDADAIRVGVLGTATGTLYFDDVLVSSNRAGAPSSNVRVRHANTHSRSELPLRTTLWGWDVNDQLTVRIDDVEQYRQNGSIRGTLAPVLDLSRFDAGTYSLTIELLGSAGVVKGAWSETIRKYVDGTPAVSIDRNNSLSLNGRLIYPVTPCVQNPPEWAEYWSAGLVNMYGLFSGYSTDYNWMQYRDFIEAIGQPSIGPNNRFCNSPARFCINEPNAVALASAYVRELKDHPGVFAWTWIDEPDLGGNPPRVSPLRIKAVMDALHEIDGNHPQLVNLYGYEPGLTKQKGFLYPTLIADIYSTDAYPRIYPNTGDIAEWIADIDRFQNYNFGLTPWMTYVEAGIQPCKDPPVCTGGKGPTPAEVTMEAWLAVIHGVKGIAWWGPEAPEFTYIDSAHKASMAQFVNQIGRLTSVVLSTPPLRTVTDDRDDAGSRVDTMIREDADAIWIFAARLTEVGETDNLVSTFSVSGLTGETSVDVFDENRTVTALEGRFTDSFTPNAVHIYKLPKVVQN